MTRQAGLKKAYEAALIDQDETIFPYYFLDLSQQGQLSTLRLYTNIFSRYKIAFTASGMKNYIIGESDFLRYFKVTFENGNTFQGTAHDNSSVEKEGEASTADTAEPEERKIEKSREAEIEPSKISKKTKSEKRRKFNKTRFSHEAESLNRWRRRKTFNLAKLKRETKTFAQ